MAKKATKKKLNSKKSVSDIMSTIIDKEELIKRKEKSVKNIEIIEEEKEKKETVELAWWQKEIKKSDFKKKEINGEYFAQHKDWKENIYIGAYPSEKELDKVIKSYVDESKKPPMYRDIKNVHSVIL